MKRLKQVICGLMACLMLADPVSMCSTAYADENAPAEPEAILQMAPVEQEGTPLLQEAEQQETGGSEQAAVETADTSAPVIDLGSIRLEKTQIASGESNTLYVSATDESEIVSISARFMRETGREVSYSTSEITLMENEQYALPVAAEIVGMWQLFSIFTADIYGNTITYLNSAHPKYQSLYGTENLCDLSAVAFEVKMDSFSTPVMDLASLSIDKNISRNREPVEISVNVENPDSVRQLEIDYIVTTDAGRSNGNGLLLSYNASLDKFRGWLDPSYFGKYEVEWIELLDYSGEWQTIYNSALTYNWTLPEDAVMYDLSALNFDSVDAQIYTMEDLKAALAEVQDGESLQIAASEDFVVDEDVTIPKGVYLNIQSGSGSFKIAEGVTFTTESQFDWYVEFSCYVPMTVEGTWRNQSAYVDDLTISLGGLVENDWEMNISNFHVEGTLKNEKQAYINSWGEFELTSTGGLENHGSINLHGDFNLDGTVTEHPGSHIYYTYKAKTLDELKELLKRAKAGDTITVDPGDSAFVISENVSVPEGVWLDLSGKNLVINTGVTFTIAGIGNVRNVAVNGTWENRGSAYCQEEVYVTNTGVIRHSKGYLFCCWGGLRIAEGGLVENNGYLHIDEKYENAGTLTNNAGATARLTLEVRSAVELNAALACENPGQKEIGFGVSDAVTLTEDVVISENTWLRVYDSSGNGKAALTVGEGVTLITRWSGYPCFECRVPLTVAGKLVNETGGIKLTKGLTITSTGCVDIEGGNINLTGEFVNSGVLVGGSRITQLLTVASMDELRSAVQKVISGGKVEIRGDSDFVISEDITIPKGITVEVYEDIQNLRLDAGAKLTVDTGATLRSYTPVEVDGTVYNYGSIGARRGMTVNGTIHNYDYIRVEGGEFVGAENVVPYVTGACSVRKAYTVDSEESLRTTLSGLDLSAWNTLTAAEGFSLTEDITIPQGVYLNIQSGTFKVPEKVVLTTYSNLDVKNMVIDGTWINYMSMAGYGYSTVSGDFELSGTVKNSGWIQLVQYSRDMVNGIENTGNGSVTYGRGNGITSLEELRKEIDSAAGSYTDVYWDMDADTVLDADLVIPAGVDLYMGGGYTLVVPEGVELHVTEGAELKSYEGVLDVQGALRVDGNCRFETIKISGLLKNTGGLSFASMCITDSGKAEDAGVMIGSVDNQGKLCSVDRTDGGKVFEVGLWRDCDWNDAFRNVRHGDSIRFTGIWDNAHIIVNEDAILPEGVNIDGDIFTVKEGATLTTNGVLSAFTMEVEGTWVNNGPSEVSLLTIDGTVQNNASITVDRAYGTQNVTGKPIIIRSEADDITSPIRATILDLQDVLDSAPKGATIICEDYHTYYGEKPVAIINENITIPAGITVELTGVSKAYLTSGHTFTVNGTLVAAQPVYIAGSLVINGEVSIPAADEIDVEYLRYLGVTMGGINIVDGGSCEINGSIRVGKTDYSGQPITDPFSVLEGVDTSSLTQRTVDGCWYLTKKTAEGKADIFCELPTAGCSLRLVGADGSMKELAPAGKGAAITNIAPGQYTLEVSKPGYVTHSVPLDTAAMADIFAVELVAVGNINGAESSLGDVDAADMQCLYTLLSTGSYDGQIKDEEYMKLVADVNGDGTINILDYQRLYMALNGAKA